MNAWLRVEAEISPGNEPSSDLASVLTCRTHPPPLPCGLSPTPYVVLSIARFHIHTTLYLAVSHSAAAFIAFCLEDLFPLLISAFIYSIRPSSVLHSWMSEISSFSCQGFESTPPPPTPPIILCHGLSLFLSSLAFLIRAHSFVALVLCVEIVARISPSPSRKQHKNKPHVWLLFCTDTTTTTRDISDLSHPDAPVLWSL